MRRWRVGTISMGVAMIFTGSFLLIAQWKGFAVADAFLAWWPLIFILLGLEICLFLFLNKKESPRLTYDMFSILFVGVLGTVCIGFFILASSGILPELRHAVHAVEQTGELADFNGSLPDGVQKIIVQNEAQPIWIDQTAQKEIRFFGSYRTDMSPEDAPERLPGQVLSTRQVGDTLYVNIRPLPSRGGLFEYHPRINATLVLPADIPFEVRGSVMKQG